MGTFTDFMPQILIVRQAPKEVAEDVIEFWLLYQKLYRCFDHGLPA
jgi:hypothetical protein